MENGDPVIARKVAEARVAQTDATLLTYCAMCRDRLAITGKPVLHLLDILFPDVALDATEPPASISSRRVSRRNLKKMVLSRYGGNEQPPQYDWEHLQLRIPESVAERIEKRRILEDDIRQVLIQTDPEGRYFVHGTDGRRIASARLGEVTFWVEYQKEDGVYQLLNCWSHRMTINPQHDTKKG